MYLSYEWLLEFIPYRGTPEELAHCLTMLGLEVEEIFNPFNQISDIVVGYIKDCQTHPGAEKLHICKVDLGSEGEKSIVCGAGNVAAGQFVPVALEDAVLPSGEQIQETKIRKQVSQGMICSEHELSLGQDKSGIMQLSGDLSPGESLCTALDLDSTVFDIGITPNRGDCLSVLGVAREVAAYYQLPLSFPSMKPSEELPNCKDEVHIQIEDPRDCPVYQTRLARDVQVGPSPDWLRYRLLAIGLRPINNIVDITNYVMFELGQPLHAFDYQLISGNGINVSRAYNSQRFSTLDGEERVLSSEDLLIQDPDKPIALAGIMGGANTEINTDSSEILLECAVFHPTLIRRTARRLNISSESSYRFERGVDQPGSINALERCAFLLQDITGARVLQGVSKKEPSPWKPTHIRFHPEFPRDLLGMEIERSTSERILRSLGCTVEEISGQLWEIAPPSHRSELVYEVDLVEEVARVYGMENIPATLPRVSKSLKKSPKEEQSQAPYKYLQRVQNWARSLGLQEAVNYSFVGSRDLEKLNIMDQNAISLYNPLTSDQNTLRPVLAPGLLSALGYNLSQGNRDIHLFEVSRTFRNDPASETAARETNILGIILHGYRYPEMWPWKTEKLDFLDLKGYLEHFLEFMGIFNYELHSLDNHPFLEAGIKILQKSRLRENGREIAVAGNLYSGLLKNYRAQNPIWIAEIDLDQVYNYYKYSQYSFEFWPKFPPVNRDMTVIASPEVKYWDIINILESSDRSCLESCKLIDLYQPQDSRDRHFTFRMTYRHTERTLTDPEVDKEHSDLGELLVNSLAVRFP